METRKVMGKALQAAGRPGEGLRPREVCVRLQQAQDHAVRRLLTCPHAHARVTSIDTGAAEELQGRDRGPRDVADAGTEIQWAGTEVAAVAATTEEIARDAVRRSRCDYEVLPHLVKEDDLKKAGSARQSGRRTDDGRSRPGAQRSRGGLRRHYGIPVVTHCCLEPHGQVIEWNGRQGRITALHAER